MVGQPKLKTEDHDEKTEVLKGEQETLNRELQAAKEHDACLIMIRGPLQGHRYFVTQAEMSVGRDPSADITIEDKSISRKHACIKKEGPRTLLVDLGSANGTYVNGNKLAPHATVVLSKEDMIRMGNSILKFVPSGEYEILFYSAMDDKAYTDALTQVSNKRYFIEALEAEFKRARTLGTEMALIILDIDHFKKINDTYGHDAGDYVLKEFASAIRSRHIRPKDVFARYGGEEFVMLLTNSGAQTAQDIAERIRNSIEAHPFIYDQKRIAVTVSLGVTELTSTIASPAAFIKLADRALYDSKQGGRNRVTLRV